MHSFKFRGFILGSKEWYEKDKLISVFTKERGKIKLLAKGVRDPKSKRAGNLETGNFIKGIAFTNNKNNFPILGEIEIIYHPLEKRKSLGYTTILLYLSELIDSFVVESQSEEPLFNFYQETLFRLAKNNDIESIVKFSVELPRLLGFGASEKAARLLADGEMKQAQKEAEKYLENITRKKITSLELIRN